METSFSTHNCMMHPIGSAIESRVTIHEGTLALQGILGLPPQATAVVLFAHGSGSGRLSPRNNFVARRLQAGGFITLLLDLLQESEPTIGAKSSTWRSWRIVCWRRRPGCPENQLPGHCPSAISAPVPAPARRCRRQPASRHQSVQWCPVVGDQI